MDTTILAHRPVLQAVQIILDHGQWFEKATDLHWSLDAHLCSRGGTLWTGDNVTKEFVVQDRGDGHRGKIDLLISPPDSRPIAIEIDRGSPRRKSLFKLRSIDAWRIIVLRGTEDGRWHMPADPAELDGIHFVIGIDVRDGGNRVLWFLACAPWRK